MKSFTRNSLPSDLPSLPADLWPTLMLLGALLRNRRARMLVV